jgi:hypothetical protein
MSEHEELVLYITFFIFKELMADRTLQSISIKPPEDGTPHATITFHHNFSLIA